MGPWLANGQDLVAGSGNPYKTRLHSQTSFPTAFLFAWSLQNFEQSLAALLSYSLQNFAMITQMEWV